MMRDRIKRAFGRSRRGAVTMMAVAGMIPAATILAANMNSGQMTNDRRAVQDAADSLAMMHGQWTARALNIISMNQVAATQAVTVAIGSEALASTLTELEITAWANLAFITLHGLGNCPPQSPNWIQAAFEAAVWTPYCTFDHFMKAIPATEAISEVSRIRREYEPDHGIRISHSALRALEGINRALVQRHPRSVGEMGEDYMREFEIEDFHFADPCINVPGATCDRTNSRDGMALPIEDGGMGARVGFCLAMETGTTTRFSTFSNRGFPRGRGPLNHGGGDSNPVVRNHINEDTGIGEALHDYKDYYSNNTLAKYLFQTDDFPLPLQLIPPQDEDGPNSFTLRFDSKRLTFCGGGVSGTSLLGYTLEAPVPTIWQLREISPNDFMPPARPEDMPELFQILAYAMTETDERVGTRVLGNAAEEQYGYGQVGVYNPDGADLYSQNWRSILMPAMRMDDPREAGRDLDQQARSSFDQLARTLQRVGDLGTWGRVNAH